MSFIPEEELKEQKGITLAPMIDLLFLLLAVFASLAVSRVLVNDTDIELVKSRSEKSLETDKNRDYKLIHITIAEDGKYNWVTEIRDHLMQSPQEIANELTLQHRRGILPEDKHKTQVLLKIDKNAKWEPILNALLAIKEAGFEVRPVYEPS